MVSLSHVERRSRSQGATTRPLPLGQRLRRAFGLDPAARPVRARATWADRLAPAKRAVEQLLSIGVDRGLPLGTQKRIRLCNVMALVGGVIMAVWGYIEVSFGDRHNLPWELAFTALFLAVLVLNGSRFHRAARLLLVLNANACVLAGAILFEEASGGVLPFFGLAAIALLMFGPDEWLLASLGALLPAVLFALCKTGVACDLLGVTPRAAPAWYFAANAVSTFAIAFLVPFFFFRSNVKAEASLQRLGQEKLKRLIDADLIGVVRGRLSGRIEDANDTFLSLLGYTRQDLAAGALDLRMLAPLEPFQSELRRGPASVYERQGRRKDGTRVPILVGMALLDESDDEIVGFVLDLTAQKHVEAQRTLLQDSREALRLRDLFNSIASHELKTPLTALLLCLQLLSRRLEKEVPDNAGLRAQALRCESAAARMGELIHALLDVAQIHRGRITLNVQEVDVAEAVRKVASAFEVGKDGGAHRIVVRAEGVVTAKVDPIRFDQLVTNLLSNAVKYAGDKPIEVGVDRGSAPDSAHVEVIDHGPGIEPSMKEKIFEPFQRAGATEPIPGLGLGLYVVKLIVDGHGGRIAVDSELGQGSKFVVDLPCPNAAQPPALAH